LTMLRAALSMRYSEFKDNIARIDTAESYQLKPYLMASTKRRKECVHYLTRMMRRESTLLQARFEGKKKYQQITSNTIMYLIFFFSMVTLLLFVLMVRELTRRMQYQEELQNKLLELRRSH